MADIGGLQLLPETRKRIEISIPGQNKFLVLGFIFIAILAVLYFGLFFYTRSLVSSINSIDRNLAALDKARDKAGENRLSELSRQLSVANSIMGNHIAWSGALNRIQDLILPQIQFQFLNADIINKRFTFKAFGANYTTVAKQVAAFYSDNLITDVSLNKVTSLPTGRVEFTMQLLIDPAIFLSKPATKPK